MMRLDSEITNDITSWDEELLLNNFISFVKNYQPGVVIFEDYNKGVLTQNIIHSIIKFCNEHDIVTTVDPKRKNFFSYKNVDIFKPNLKEVKEALNLLADDRSETHFKTIHAQLQNILQHKISIITLSEKGLFFQEGNDAKVVPSHIRNIADVSGAGDTVIAVASLVYAVTKNITLSAQIANLAGGLVCEQVGTVAIDKDVLYKECNLLLPLIEV